MRNLLLAAAATHCDRVASRGPRRLRYAGIDAGVMFPRSNNVFGSIDFIDPPSLTDFPATSFASVKLQERL